MVNFTLEILRVPKQGEQCVASGSNDPRLILYTVEGRLNKEWKQITVTVTDPGGNVPIFNESWRTAPPRYTDDEFIIACILSILFRNRCNTSVLPSLYTKNFLNENEKYNLVLNDKTYEYTKETTRQLKVGSKITRIDDCIMQQEPLAESDEAVIHANDRCRYVQDKTITATAMIFSMSAISLVIIHGGIKAGMLTTAAVGGMSVIGLPYLSVALIAVCAVSFMIGWSVVGYQWFRQLEEEKESLRTDYSENSEEEADDEFEQRR